MTYVNLLQNENLVPNQDEKEQYQEGAVEETAEDEAAGTDGHRSGGHGSFLQSHPDRLPSASEGKEKGEKSESMLGPNPYRRYAP